MIDTHINSVVIFVPSRPLSTERSLGKASGTILCTSSTEHPSGKNLLFVGVNAALQRLMKLRSDIKIGEVSTRTVE